MKKPTKLLSLLAILGIAGIVASCHKYHNNNYMMSNQDFVTRGIKR